MKIGIIGAGNIGQELHARRGPIAASQGGAEPLGQFWDKLGVPVECGQHFREGAGP